MRKTLTRLALIAAVGLNAAPVLAASNVPDEVPEHDARLEGYNVNGDKPSLLMAPPSGSAGAWFLTVLLGGICFGAMCKNGKRTHLD